MAPGSVIVDLAGDSGGNCELTEAGKTVVSDNGVKVISPVNLPPTWPPTPRSSTRRTSRTCSACWSTRRAT